MAHKTPQMPSPIFISRPPAGFTILAVIRGVQLTFLGAIRALRNPYLNDSGFYKKAGNIILISLIAQLIIWMPLGILNLLLSFFKLIVGNDNRVSASLTVALDTLSFIQNNVLNIGPFLVTAVRYFRPEMDEM